MGIDGSFQYLKRKGMAGTPVSPKDLNDAFFEIDLLGTYYWYLIERLTSNVAAKRDPNRVGRAMAGLLSSTFDPARCVVHIDGNHTEQKRKAYTERDAKRKKAQESLKANLDTMEERSTKGKWTSKSVISQIEKGLRGIYVLTSQTKSMVGGGLNSTFQVCFCNGEADTCIAIKFKNSPTTTIQGRTYRKVAVSSDSDFLMYESINRVLRRNPRSHDFCLYKKDSVVATLKLPSSAHLAVLGVVSSNDYGPNIPRHGIYRNSTILKAIGTAASDARSILGAYIAHVRTHTQVQVASSFFDNAAQVFLDLSPRISSSSSRDNNGDYEAALARFEILKTSRLQNKAQRDNNLRQQRRYV